MKGKIFIMPTKADIWSLINKYRFSGEASLAVSYARTADNTAIPLEAVHTVQKYHDHVWRQLEQALSILTKEIPLVVPKDEDREHTGRCSYCHGTQKVWAETWDEEDEVKTTYVVCPACQEPRTRRRMSPGMIEWLDEDPLEIERWMELAPGTMEAWIRYLNHCFRSVKADVNIPQELDEVIQAMIDDADDPYGY
jgi:hypothetical protein